jgi:hypothetical protein
MCSIILLISALCNLLYDQLRTPDVDGVAREKLNDGERAVGDEDKVLVPLHEIEGFRDPL